MRYMHSRLTFQGKDATNHLKQTKTKPPKQQPQQKKLIRHWKIKCEI